jgi:serine/threonine protein kinase
MIYAAFRRRYLFDETTSENLGKDGGFNLGVFKAIDTTRTVNNTVIVKISQPKSGIFVNNEAKFILDARIDSPYIANYLNWAEHAGKIYTAMEYYEEKSLREKMDNNSFSENADKEQFLRKVLEGIKALHSHKPEHITHKDLKPENILIDIKNGQFIPQIADFGISAFARKNTGGYIVRNDACDARYASPEQNNGTQDVPMNADLYSFGVMALELFTGKRPCDLRGNNELQNTIAEVPYENWRHLIEQCLKNRFDRVQSVDACFGILNKKKLVDDEGIYIGGNGSNGGNETGRGGDNGGKKSTEKPKYLKWLPLLIIITNVSHPFTRP